MVSREKFEGACEELNLALRREEQAQELLNEQTKQIHLLSDKLDEQATAGAEKDKTLSTAAGVRLIIIFSSPVGSLCHTPGVVRRPLSIVCCLCPP